ncbi:MAG: adenylosuccinate lyase [Nitrospinota bacterium]
MHYTDAVHPMDMKLYQSKFSTPNQRRIWSEENIIAKRLLVEATLAEAQAELGMIPREAAEEIRKKATTEHLTAERYAELYALKGHDIVALVWGLNEVCEKPWGEYVHWRSTTQDILWTSTAILIQEAIDDLLREMRETEGVMMRLMEEHKLTLMAGRTHGQHCPPITFGFYLGILTAALRRHIERMKAARERIRVAKITGAVGTGSSYGPPEVALELGERVAAKLGLTFPTITESEVTRDRVAEYLDVLSLTSVTFEKLFRDIWTYQRPEIGEVAEPFREGEQVGSSTLAHKRNPFGCEWVQGVARMIRSHAYAVNEIFCFDIRDGVRLAVEYTAVPACSCMAAAMLSAARAILAGLQVNRERMRKNLFIEKGLSMDEPVMLALAQHLGRQSAHELVYNITHGAFHEGLSLKEALLQDETVRKYLSASDIDRLTDYGQYLGTAPHQVGATLEALRGARAADGM